MNESLITPKRDTIEIARNPNWINGKSRLPFVVIVKIGDFFREYEQATWDCATHIANDISDLYRVNYTIEKGL